jgi:hypothetical protein
MFMLRTVMLVVLVTSCSKEGKGFFESGSGSAAKEPVKEAPPADLGYDVAFKTFRSGGNALNFTTKTKVEHWWANMDGNTVHGTYVQHGSEIEITWEKVRNYGVSVDKFHQLGPCSFVRYEYVMRADHKSHEDTLVYQQSQPRCDTVRVAR